MWKPAAIVTPLLVVASVLCPAAHADTTFGPGTYTVPDQLPRGIYTARVDVRDPGAAECTYSTWTSGWKFLYGNSAGTNGTIRADISATEIGHLITHGCTPWTKAE